MAAKRSKNDEAARAEVTVSIRGAGGRVVGTLSPRRTATDEAVLSFVTPLLGAGTYEASSRIVVARDGVPLTDHAHRFTFSVP